MYWAPAKWQAHVGHWDYSEPGTCSPCLLVHSKCLIKGFCGVYMYALYMKRRVRSQSPFSQSRARGTWRFWGDWLSWENSPGLEYSCNSVIPQSQWWRTVRLLVFVPACCAALTELVLNDTNAHQVVQVSTWGSVPTSDPVSQNVAFGIPSCGFKIF